MRTASAGPTALPLGLGDLVGALADAPVLIDGMRVQFDEKVALYPVRLRPQVDEPEEHDDVGA